MEERSESGWECRLPSSSSEPQKFFPDEEVTSLDLFHLQNGSNSFLLTAPGIQQVLNEWALLLLLIIL